MTYFVASLIAIPVTVLGIVGFFKARVTLKYLFECINERRTAALGDTGATPLPPGLDEARFTRSLLALSKVRSRQLDDSPERELAESSWLVSVPHALSKTRDPEA